MADLPQHYKFIKLYQKPRLMQLYLWLSGSEKYYSKKVLHFVWLCDNIKNGHCEVRGHNKI